MKFRIRALIVALLTILGLSLAAVTAAAPSSAAPASPVVAVAAPAAVPAVASALLPAGSNNGTNNWYKTRTCYASGGNLHITNYDIIVSGSVWQRYHIDADRAGGTGAVPKVYTRPNINYSWQNTGLWNDFYMDQSNQFAVNDFKVQFADGSGCAMGAF
jgi:hypothetical protein